MAGPYIYIELLSKGIGGPPDELLHIVDKLADQIGDTSSRIGHMRATLEDAYLEFRIAAPCLGGRTHACSVATYYHKSLLCHKGSTSLSGQT